MNQFKIILDKEDPRWYVLLWEGETWKKVYKSLFSRSLRPLFLVSSIEEAEGLFLEIERKTAKRFAIESLAKKGMFVRELSQKMREKGISEKAIFEIITLCQDLGALDDQKLLDAKMQSALKKGRGPLYVQSKLYKYGAPPVSLESKEAEKSAIFQVIQKKIKTTDPLDFKQKRALFLFLLRRGFQKELVEEVLRSEL